MKSKILTLPLLRRRLRAHRKRRRRIVFTNGCFDLLHLGHIRLLEAARKRGALLVVAVNSDASVRRLKGSSRPIYPAAARARMLAALACVDYVILFKEETPRRLLRELRPDILVKGKDYPKDRIVGREYVRRVCRVPLLPGYSTTRLLSRLSKTCR